MMTGSKTKPLPQSSSTAGYTGPHFIFSPSVWRLGSFACPRNSRWIQVRLIGLATLYIYALGINV